MQSSLALSSLAVCTGLATYFGWAWSNDERRVFLPGATTHGHHQIELACNSCHDPWNGATQQSCEGCHGAELELADDSHPRSKFTDPRNADRVAKLDARECVTCHVEHKPELTRTMGLTQPEDYCFLCHSDIGVERASHDGLGFETCASAGCHNFHDNRSLHEDYLEQHLREPAVLGEPVLRSALAPKPPVAPDDLLTAADQDAPASLETNPEVVQKWAASAHARAGVNCSDCHQATNESARERAVWTDAPGEELCGECHEGPREGFLAGRHGMRLSLELSAMQPGMARLPMRSDAHSEKLGCNSCHGAHDYDLATAASDACQGCHADDHTRAYAASPHAALARAERGGTGPRGSGVTCATCHMPALEVVGQAGTFQVEHNQNANLRPNEKMIREVCASCHGVPFSIDALADPALIANNFEGKPTRHVESTDMVLRKLQSIEASRAP